MKTLIYQYWLGKPGIAVKAGSENMKAYAKLVGADYKLTTNPTWASKKCDEPEYYNAFEPIYNPSFYEKYDKILFVDIDVFAVEGLDENIFDIDIGHIGFCDEPHKEKSHLTTKSPLNTKNDEAWNSVIKKYYKKEIPRNEAGQLKIFNSGVVLYTKKGLEQARNNFVPFQGYINICRKHGLPQFYSLDQNYLVSMLKIASLDYTILDAGWNSYIHYGEHVDKAKPRPVVDTRTDKTKFVHVQLRGADDDKKTWCKDAAWHHTITNEPVEKWKL